jgi:hypothetical protein
MNILLIFIVFIIVAILVYRNVIDGQGEWTIKDVDVSLFNLEKIDLREYFSSKAGGPNDNDLIKLLAAKAQKTGRGCYFIRPMSESGSKILQGMFDSLFPNFERGGYYPYYYDWVLVGVDAKGKNLSKVMIRQRHVLGSDVRKMGLWWSPDSNIFNSGINISKDINTPGEVLINTLKEKGYDLVQGVFS